MHYGVYYGVSPVCDIYIELISLKLFLLNCKNNCYGRRHFQLLHTNLSWKLRI